MAVQTQAMEAPKIAGLSRKDLLTTLLILFLGAITIVLGAYGTGAGDQAEFTDQVLGTLFILPSQATLYSIGAFCFFIAGVRLFRFLTSLRALMSWLVVILAAFAFLVWVTSGGSMNLPGMIQATLTAATPLTLGAMAGILCERVGIINIAIEGMMLSGAFAAVAFASLFDSLWMGLLAGSLVGGLMAALHARAVDQVQGGPDNFRHGDQYSGRGQYSLPEPPPARARWIEHSWLVWRCQHSCAV